MDEITEQSEFVKQVRDLLEQGIFYKELYFDLANKYEHEKLEANNQVNKLHNTIALKDAQIQDLTVLVKGLKREVINLECELNKLHLDYKTKGVK